jgi:hypothetical protein
VDRAPCVSAAPRDRPGATSPPAPALRCEESRVSRGRVKENLGGRRTRWGRARPVMGCQGQPWRRGLPPRPTVSAPLIQNVNRGPGQARDTVGALRVIAEDDPPLDSPQPHTLQALRGIQAGLARPGRMEPITRTHKRQRRISRGILWSLALCPPHEPRAEDPRRSMAMRFTWRRSSLPVPSTGSVSTFTK